MRSVNFSFVISTDLIPSWEGLHFLTKEGPQYDGQDATDFDIM